MCQKLYLLDCVKQILIFRFMRIFISLFKVTLLFNQRMLLKNYKSPLCLALYLYHWYFDKDFKYSLTDRDRYHQILRFLINTSLPELIANTENLLIPQVIITSIYWLFGPETWHPFNPFPLFKTVKVFTSIK